MKIDKPGIYFDFDSEAYFSDPCPQPSLTQSIAKVLIDQSPLHAKTEHPRLTPPTEADEDEKYVAAQAIGNAAHKMLIGRGKQIAAAPWNNWRTKEASAFRAEQTKAGKTPVLERHVAEAYAMTLAARMQLINAGWDDCFSEGKGHGEVVLAWQEDGIWLRTMIDWLSVDKLLAYDLKTGGVSFAPHDLPRKMVTDGWDVQAAMHERALNALDPKNAGRRKFRFVGLENYLPYALVPVEMTETWLTMGRKKLDFAITQWRRCIETGIWQGYGAEIVRPAYPGWKETEWLNREIAAADGPSVLMAG